MVTPLVTPTHVLAPALSLFLLDDHRMFDVVKSFKERVWPYNASLYCTYPWAQPSLIKTGESSGSPHS